MIQNKNDLKFISYALNLSKNNLGLTSPNPVVGCVIEKDGIIIATGVTAINGRPHAEKIAIEKAISQNKSLKNATIYTTLEPCSHFGETPPCTDEIIKHQFKKVVISTIDSDKRVNGDGIKKLKAAGIEVAYGVLEKEAREINKAFFKARLNGIPYITIKFATSLDAKIATKNFDSKWITCEQSRYYSHHLRSVNDAILIGANTLRKDNPKLDCRITGLEQFSPKRIVITNNLNFDLDLQIFKTAKSISTIILTTETNHNNDPILRNLENLGVNVIFCNKENGKVEIKDALKKLCNFGINSILVEGGSNLSSQFIKENLADEIIWIRSKKIIGNDGIAAIAEMEFTNISDVLNNFDRKEFKECGNDVIEVYDKTKE